MITFHVRCRLREGQWDKAERFIRDLVVAVQREESGAVAYSFFRNAQDPSEVVLVESYSDNEAFLAHNSSPRMVAFRERFNEWFDPSTNEVSMLQDIAGFGREWSGVEEPSVVV